MLSPFYPSKFYLCLFNVNNPAEFVADHIIILIDIKVVQNQILLLKSMDGNHLKV